jgi:hypothetical protein
MLSMFSYAGGLTIQKKEPIEPGDAPRIGFEHRKVYLL